MSWHFVNFCSEFSFTSFIVHRAYHICQHRKRLETQQAHILAQEVCVMASGETSQKLCEDRPQRRIFGADIWTYFIVEFCGFIFWQKPWQTNIDQAFTFHWDICNFLYFPLILCIINQINLCTITVKFIVFFSLVIFCIFNFRALG